jgi:hypothetical protein
MVGHPAYRLAKTGVSTEAALQLAYDCIADDAMQRLKAKIGAREPRIVAVHAEESQGRNKIPLAYGEVLAAVLGLDTDPGIVQCSVANHTAAPSIYHRLVSPPVFDGYVEKGADYLIVDDTCTMGGTLANLKGFIEHHGGSVVGMSVLSLSNPRLLYDIDLSGPTRRQITMRHPTLDAFLKEDFGYGIECLTEGEAGNLRAAPSVDTIRNRLAEARRDLGIDGNESSDAGTSGPTEVVN